jgi:hypothetical protein
MRLNAKKFRVSSVYWPKREFDPASSNDLSEYKYFLDHSSWRDGCPFLVEWPYLDVIKCIEDKMIRYHIGNLIKAAK